MFNPFQAQVMQVVLENLRRRFNSQDAELYIIYFNPVQAPLLDASPYLEKIRTTRLYSVYRSRPSQRPVNLTLHGNRRNYVSVRESPQQR